MPGSSPKLITFFDRDSADQFIPISQPYRHILKPSADASSGRDLLLLLGALFDLIAWESEIQAAWDANLPDCEPRSHSRDSPQSKVEGQRNSQRKSLAGRNAERARRACSRDPISVCAEHVRGQKTYRQIQDHGGNY